jgi:flagellar basal body-associated protein FliL
MIDTGKKVINLAEPDGRTYIQVRITLEFAPGDPSFYMPHTAVEGDESGGGHGGGEAEGAVSFENTFTEEVQAKLPVINDLIISLISSKKFEDVYTSEGKEMLREEIATQINTMLPDYHISYVYFTEFVVQ